MNIFINWPEYYQFLLGGLGVSLLLTLAAISIGLPIGIALAFALDSNSTLVRSAATVVIELGRGAPGLVILQFIYFGLPSVHIVLTSVTAAIVALSWITAAVSSHYFRSGMKSIPAGEIEAAAALGMSLRDSRRFVIIPQGFRIAIPSLMGLTIQIFQATSLAYVITVPELLSRAYSIASVNFDYLGMLALAGLMYVVVAMPATWLTVFVERRLEQRMILISE